MRFVDERNPDSVDWGCPVNWGHPLNRGLVSWWLAVPGRMGWKTFTWRDLCGRNHGTLTNGPAWGGAAGRPGGFGAMTFDGSDDYIVIPAAINDALPGSNITVTAWIYAGSSSFNMNGAIVTEVYTGDSNIKFCLTGYHSFGAATKLSAGFYNGDWHLVHEAGDFTFGVWAHVAASYDGSAIRLYVNGLLENSASDAAGLPTSTDEWRIGRRWDNPDYFNGLVDDVRIYNRALSAPEVRALYLASCAGYPHLLNRPRRRYYVSQAASGLLMARRRACV